MKPASLSSQRLQFSRKLIALVLLSFLLVSTSNGQDKLTSQVDTTCVQRDLPDVLRQAMHKPPKVKPSGEGSLLLLPIIGSNPATGFMVGIGGQFAKKLPGSTLYSTLSGSAQFTTKKQIIFMLKNNIYTKNNNIYFSGDWRFLIYSQSTYGLGTNSPEGGALDYQYALLGQETSDDSLIQPMKFNFARLHQSASFKIKEGLYLGFGYNFDSYSKINDEKLRLTPGDSLLTSHYLYNAYYGFSTTSYFLSALNLNVVYDTRDNMINPYRGIYVMASWRGGMKFLGNKNTTNFYQVEFRAFQPLSKSNPRHLLAFWLMGNFAPSGEFPYLILPATAYDQRGRSGRGYTQGRFRGNNLVYGETEYRFPISKCGGIWGGVLFVNATTADKPAFTSSTGEITKSLKLFESIKPGYGAGLRIMVDKHSKTNLAVDIGFGDKSFGFYLAASEAF